ncbi:hypothetical protein LINGRAHAP2_LOCUS20324 [Linum grandiflorum]
MKMKEMVDESKESDHPITPEEALHAVLGSKSGYCKGMGYGPKPPSAKQSKVDSEIAYLKELNKQLAEENSRFKESQVEYERRQVEYVRKQAESDRRQAEAEARLAASDAKQEIFQKFMDKIIEKQGSGNLINI